LPVEPLARPGDRVASVDDGPVVISAAEALAFVWQGQEGRFVEVRPEPNDIQHFEWREEALARVAEWSYFAPVPRVTPGAKKVNSALTANVLWVDIDNRDDLESALGELPAPSLVIDTGRGRHLYWKLTEPIPIDTVEQLNKFIASQVGGDTAAWDRARILRVPGSIKAATGLVARVEGFTGEVFEPELWTSRLPAGPRGHSLAIDDPLPAPPSSDRVLWDEVRALAADHRPRSRKPLSSRFTKYLTTGETSRRSRSEEEMAILSASWRCGWELDEIVVFADEHLSKHREERRAGGGYHYLLVSLRKVIGDYAPEWTWSSTTASPNPPSCVCDRASIKRGTWIDRFIVVRDLLGEEEMPLADLKKNIAEVFDCEVDTARKIATELIATGIIKKTGKDPKDRRKDLVRRDPELYSRL